MRKDIVKALGLFSQIGLSMLAPILLCTFIGSFLDETFNTGGILLIVMLLLGIGAGFRGVYMLTKEFYKDRDEK